VASNSAINWKGALLPEGASIEQAIRRLNDAALQIVMVINSDGQLVGTITDGDIRRGLLRGLTVADATDDIVARQALVVPPDMRPESIMQLMRANRIHQLPVVDEQRHVVGLHLWDEISEPGERANLMVIMAGGLGTRLAPHTETCPKPLLPVAGKPMLEHILERAKTEGFFRFVLAVNYLGNMIEEYFGNGKRWQINIEYLREEDPLGTSGALGLLDPAPELPFIVTNGDVLTDIRYGELLDFHIRNAAEATMAVRLYEWQHPFGVVQTKGVEIVGFEEKPVHRSHISAGVYALSPKALMHLDVGQRCDMPALFERLRLGSARTIVYPMHEPWLDVGSTELYLKIKENGQGRV
jgi:dTDP-glucose pyrophosphorylase